MAKFDPREADRFLKPERSQWQDPDLILDRLGVAAGMSFVDVGAGPGFFALPAARRVGPEGRVYALDVEPSMLERLRERAAAAGLTNIECLVSQGDKLPLPDSTADAILVANVLHEVRERLPLLREVARLLRPAGALAVVEWRKEQTEMGPPPAERLTYQEVERDLREAGFQTVEPFEVGPYHFGVRAHK